MGEIATTQQKTISFEDAFKKCGNLDKINKIKTNMENIEEYVNNMKNNVKKYNNKIDELTDIFMDDKVYRIIDDTINIFSSMTNDEMFCFYNNIYGEFINKNRLCKKIQELTNMNDMHSQINKIVNKYIVLLVKLRKRLLNAQLFIVNKDCKNITIKKNKLEEIINEYNKSLKRAFQLLYIYPNEQKELMNQIQ
jgi:tetrahydromethanopterin S-methyltransferase subunit B